MSMMTNFRAEDMPGSNGPKPVAKKAPAKIAPKKIEKPVEAVEPEVETVEGE